MSNNGKKWNWLAVLEDLAKENDCVYYKDPPKTVHWSRLALHFPVNIKNIRDEKTLHYLTFGCIGKYMSAHKACYGIQFDYSANSMILDYLKYFDSGQQTIENFKFNHSDKKDEFMYVTVNGFVSDDDKIMELAE
jgi:hypothetical protein